MPTITIQTSPGDVNTSRPYPYRIESTTGDVLDQDIWRGDPTQLLGFQADVDVQRVSLFRDDWVLGDLQAAVGMFPVFSTDNTIYHLTIPVTSVTVVEAGTANPPPAVPPVVNTHRAVIESSMPPGLNLIAAGPKGFCEARLLSWVEAHPLGEFDRALIMEVLGL